MTGAPLSYAGLPEDVLAEIFAGADQQFKRRRNDPLLAQPYADQVRLTVFAARAEREQAA